MLDAIVFNKNEEMENGRCRAENKRLNHIQFLNVECCHRWASFLPFYFYGTSLKRRQECRSSIGSLDFIHIASTQPQPYSMMLKGTIFSVKYSPLYRNTVGSLCHLWQSLLFVKIIDDIVFVIAFPSSQAFYMFMELPIGASNTIRNDGPRITWMS